MLPTLKPKLRVSSLGEKAAGISSNLQFHLQNLQIFNSNLQFRSSKQFIYRRHQFQSSESVRPLAPGIWLASARRNPARRPPFFRRTGLWLIRLVIWGSLRRRSALALDSLTWVLEFSWEGQQCLPPTKFQKGPAQPTLGGTRDHLVRWEIPAACARRPISIWVSWHRFGALERPLGAYYSGRRITCVQFKRRIQGPTVATSKSGASASCLIAHLAARCAIENPSCRPWAHVRRKFKFPDARHLVEWARSYVAPLRFYEAESPQADASEGYVPVTRNGRCLPSCLP